MKTVLAVDLGASGGRVMLCRLADLKITSEEVHRFENIPIELNGRLCWDFERLLNEIKTGLKKAGDDCGSVGIDTWGVDFAIVDADKGSIIEGPVCYRDTRTAGISASVHDIIPPEELYSRTGLQTMEINTLYQLTVLKKERPELFKKDARLLHMPDLFGWALTGNAVSELSIASTSQLLNPQSKQWDSDLLGLLGFNKDWFGDIALPGTPLGALKPSICEELGISPKQVYCVAGHDTACAVAAAPYMSENTLFLSSGTWSLIGAELENPILTQKSAAANLSNEVGYGGKIRYLKNLTGTWILQQIRQAWSRPGRSVSFERCEKLAAESPPFAFFINPDAEEFMPPGDMPARIMEHLLKTGQKTPEWRGGVVRAVFDSLAAKIHIEAQSIEDNCGKEFTGISMMGGGTKSALLCQTIADLTQKTVYAGPAEATALGNAMIQFISGGHVRDIAAAREIIRNSSEIREYRPSISKEEADLAIEKFNKFIT